MTTYRHLPVSYTTQREKLFSATAPKMWLKNAQKTIIKYPTTLTNNTWILVNPQQTGEYKFNSGRKSRCAFSQKLRSATGLFRVNYDAENWRMLRKSLLDGDLPSNVRAQLMDDALFLARSNYLNYEVALDLVRTLPVYGEKEFIVWNTVLRHLTYVENIINSIEDANFEKQRILFKVWILYF